MSHTRLQHPSAKANALRADSDARLATLPSGWRWPFGWRIRLFSKDGDVHDRYTRARATYEEAKALMLEELKHPRFESAQLLRLEAHHP